jgi:hypothetical protein
MPSAHIGSPPERGGTPLAAEWRAKKAAYDGALGAMNAAWTGLPPASAGDFRLTIQHYEEAVRTTLNTGGYGNVILAMKLRRMSQTMAARYVILHPSQAQDVQEILQKDRICIIDSTAVAEMIAEELGVRRSLTAPKLSEDRDELRQLFVADGTTYDRAMDSLFGGLNSAQWMVKRNISELLVGLLADEFEYRVTFAALLEFLKRGGDTRTPESFGAVIGRDYLQYHFAPFGRQINVDVRGLLRRDSFLGTPMPFKLVVGE